MFSEGGPSPYKEQKYFGSFFARRYLDGGLAGSSFALHSKKIIVGRKEARVGIEPTNRGFADPCLTTWLRDLKKIRFFKVYKSYQKNTGYSRISRILHIKTIFNKYQIFYIANQTV